MRLFNTIGKKLLWGIAVPSLVVCLSGIGWLWERTEDALQRSDGNAEQITRHFETAFYGVVAAAAVLALATGLSLRIFFHRPLARLAADMRQAERGDFLVRADDRRDDEIGQLSKAFNALLARITSMMAEEIDTHRFLAMAEEQVALKEALETKSVALERRLRELSLLSEFSTFLTSTLELSELLARLSQLVAERLTIDQFSIMLINSEGKLEVKAAYPTGVGTEGLTFRIGEGVCGRAAQSMKALYVADLEADNELYTRRSGNDVKQGSLLAIPMVHADTLLGVLNLQRPEKHGFLNEEVEFFKAVAGQAALAVKNSLLHEQMVTLSNTDPLTGVPNRRYLFSQLDAEFDRAKRYATPLSVLMVDIDSFKHLNDNAGHMAGDDVLRRVAQLMAHRIRRADTLGRYGGEEFMILLPQLHKAEALEVGEKIRRAVVETPFEQGRYQPLGKVTLSVGVASYPEDASTLDRLLDSVDASLYASKRGGRNRVSGYESGMELHPGRERGPHAAASRRKPTPISVPQVPEITNR